jgi:hypothetical protein
MLHILSSHGYDLQFMPKSKHTLLAQYVHLHSKYKMLSIYPIDNNKYLCGKISRIWLMSRTVGYARNPAYMMKQCSNQVCFLSHVHLCQSYSLFEQKYPKCPNSCSPYKCPKWACKLVATRLQSTRHKSHLNLFLLFTMGKKDLEGHSLNNPISTSRIRWGMS